MQDPMGRGRGYIDVNHAAGKEPREKWFSNWSRGREAGSHEEHTHGAVFLAFRTW